MDIPDRVALVTGSARRVGRALALGLARAGAHIVVHHHESTAEAASTAREIEGLGRRAHAVAADLSTPDGVAHLAARTEDLFGRLDILVHNASRFERASFEQITEAEWDRVLGVNVKAPFFLTQALLHLLRLEGGVIVHIADLSALQAWPSYAHHAVSKAGLLHLTRVLARALGPGIRVNAIVPGTVLPPPDWTGEDEAGGPARRVVMRDGSPDDVVDALLYLVRSDFVTGETLVVDGGRHIL